MDDHLFGYVVAFIIGVFAGLSSGTLLLTPWRRAFMLHGRVSMTQILSMRLRGNPVNLILDAHLALVQSGAKSSIAQVETKYVATLPRIETADELMRLVGQDLEAASTEH